MIKKLKWERMWGLKIRLLSALRCLFSERFVLVCWVKEPDGDNTFTITHKGVTLPEAVHRLKVDAVEILQDQCDQEDAIYEASQIINKIIS